MAVFPDLGKPLAANYQETPPDNLVRTPMDVGPAKLRRRTTANVRQLSVLYVVDVDQDCRVSHLCTLNGVDHHHVKPVLGWL